MSRVLRILTNLEEWCIGLLLLSLAVFVFIQVVLRYGFHFAFTWAEELGRYLTVLLTFLGASLGIRYGTHFSMEALVQYLPDRYCHLLKAVVNLTCGLFFLLIVYFAALQIEKLHRYGASTATLHMPMYVPYIPIPVCSVTIAARFFCLACRHAMGFVRNERFGKKIM
jgi:C4-dicarboxylate transporter DctQ subunit